MFDPNPKICNLVERHLRRNNIPAETFPTSSQLLFRFLTLAQQHGAPEKGSGQPSSCSAVLLDLDPVDEALYSAYRIFEFERKWSLTPTFLAGYTMNPKLVKMKYEVAGIKRIFGTGLDPEWIEGFARDPSCFRDREI
ncbi:hypothetical protein [Acanthopleuribacter pedis]